MKGRWMSLFVISSLGWAAACATATPDPASPEPPLVEGQTPKTPKITPSVSPPPEAPLPEDPTPERHTMEHMIKAPTFTPYTQPPDITNRSDVTAALQEAYPKELREAGIEGTAQVWFFIDAEGVVQRLQINKSSGDPDIDAAALRVASVVQFSPALNRDEPVAVWISLPISFITR